MSHQVCAGEGLRSRQLSGPHQDPVRVLAFVQKRPGISPGQRFRLEQWAPHLAARHDIRLDFCAFESPRLTEVLYLPGHTLEKGVLMLRDFARRADAVRLARGYDAVVVYREASTLGPALWERVLSRLEVPFLLDFDDAIWMSPDAGPRAVNGVFSRLRFPGKTRKIALLASAVTVGNEFLARWARELNPNVHIVPTSIELAAYPVQAELESDDPFVIGWMGSHSTLINLEQVREAVERFGARRRTRFVTVCDRPLARPFANVENVFVPWSAEREAADLGRLHVGLMPLLDFPFAHGKCGCKALQYMAAGRPAVIAPIGVNSDIVRDGENGFLATTTDEWVQALERLAMSTDLRQRVALAGRQTVERGYSAVAAAAQFAASLHSIFARSTAAGAARGAPQRGTGP